MQSVSNIVAILITIERLLNIILRIIILAIALRFLATHCRRHRWSKMMWLLLATACAVVVLLMTIQLLLEPKHLFFGMMNIHIVSCWCVRLALSIIAWSSVLVVGARFHCLSRGSIRPTATTQASISCNTTIWSLRWGTVAHLITSCD